MLQEKWTFSRSRYQKSRPFFESRFEKQVHFLEEASRTQCICSSALSGGFQKKTCFFETCFRRLRERFEAASREVREGFEAASRGVRETFEDSSSLAVGLLIVGR
jgi:hypothetical protein